MLVATDFNRMKKYIYYMQVSREFLQKKQKKEIQHKGEKIINKIFLGVNYALVKLQNGSKCWWLFQHYFVQSDVLKNGNLRAVESHVNHGCFF